ncbi:hypothetical protein GCM10010344_53740 [Streptomyces bluensis]|nr:hypothetical protein GCM10010344_53740 [Streptomyces bluensis]
MWPRYKIPTAVDLADALERMVTALVPITHGPGPVQDGLPIEAGTWAGTALAAVAETKGRARAPRRAAETAIRVERMGNWTP